MNTPANTVEDYRARNSFYHAASGTHFTMLERSGKYYQRRYQIGSDGKETNVEEKQIDFAMGSGDHVRTYLHRTPQGALQELPLAWYAERGGYWAMNPGYDTPIQPNSRRKITYECMFCHNAYPEIPAGHDQLRAEPIFTGTMPEGIDCQRCHGPGRRHVEIARSLSSSSLSSSGALRRPSAEAVRGSIVNPARLTADRQMEVCAQCHLETDSFPFPHSILNYDRGPFSYRPGEPLADFMLSFDHAPSALENAPAARDHAPSNPPDDRFQIVNSVYRLRMSACFLKSEGKMQCTTCHDPHEAKRTSESYNGICRQCHAAAFTKAVTEKKHAAAPNCIACHMPKRRTEDVVHAVMTDHFIQRRNPDIQPGKPARDLLADIAEPHGPEIIYHGEVVSYGLGGLGKLVRTPEDELYLALAQVREDNNPNGLPQFAAAVERFRPAQAEFYIELADAFVKAGQAGNAIPAYKEALRRRPDSLAAALGLGDAFEKSNDEANALEAFRQATKLDAADAGAWRRLGEAQMKLGRSGEAVVSSVVALQKSLELDAEAPETHYALAALFAQPGAAGSNGNGRAEASYREAIRLQPDYSAAHMNLAILLFRGNRAGEARDHFESAIRYHPDYGLGHYNFGLMLIAQNRFDEAMRQMELAVEYGSALDSKTREAAQQRLSELRDRR